MIKVANGNFFSVNVLVVLGAFAFMMFILFLFSTSGSEAATITVDDDGLAMYSRIQDAINASKDRDTVYVYNGTYYENVIVNRSINLTGENHTNTIIDGGGIDSVVLVVSDWVNVTGFNIVNSGMNISDAGVKLDGVQNCNISHNNISHNKEMGIHLNYSHSNTIFDNIITYNWDWGIYLEYADFNFIWNNLIDTNGKGIGIFYSTYEIIELNNITETGGYGIFFSFSGNSSVKNNTIVDNAAAGIEAEYSVNLTFGWNLVGREKYGCTYGVVLWSCDENVIFNNTLQGNGYGVYLSSSDKNDIMNNNISGSIDIGIDLFYSNQNNIINNSFENNMEGIKLRKSHDNRIIDNIIPISIGQGLTCENSNRTTIAGNDFSEGYWWGMYFSWCSFNNITNNNLSAITGFPPFDGHGVYMENSQKNNITNNIISSNDGYGIQLLSSSSNIISRNNISYNLLGINISNSLGNCIFHNTIIGNTEQAYDDSDNGNFWNHSYPVGGNYWSDYTGNDVYKGPNQDQQGSDGIGDTPYVIDINSLDNYPLMQPHQFYNISNYPPCIITQDNEIAYADIIYIVDYEAFDYEGDPLTWYLLTNASWLSINFTTGVLSGTPNISHIGSYWVNISVDDGNGGMDFHNFTLTVFETNYPPIITTPNLEWALEDSLYWVDYECTDGNNDSVTWQLVSNASWLGIDPITGNLTGIPENNNVGSFWVNVSVDDGMGGIDYTNFTLTVNNTPPLLTTIPIDHATEDLLHIDDFNSTDDNPGEVTYTLYTNATWLNIIDMTGILSGTPDNSHVGWFWVNVTVDDGNGGFGSINYTLTVNNSPPLIVTTPKDFVYVGQLYNVDFNSTDDGQGTILYYLLTNASWLGIDQLTGIVSGTPSIDDVGWYWVNVSVSHRRSRYFGRTYNLCERRPIS
jgi:parallel beta-helix repeat protein